MTHSPLRPLRPGRRLVPLLLPLAVVAAACGQKSGVAEQESSAGTGTVPIATLPVDTLPAGTAAPGPTGTTAAGATTAPPSATTAAPGATTVAAATTAPPASTTAAAPGAPFTPGPDDTAGVSDTEIVIGIHAPVTGASPIPQTSFDIGKDIYWEFLAGSDPDALFGRTVRVVFRDDEFNPQHAVAVCREMVEEEGAFLLIGGGGADQITACAEYADETGIPYLSAGVNQTGVVGLDTYFATSLTYSEQSGLLTDQIRQFGVNEIGLVVADTPSFDDFYELFKRRAADDGMTIAYETRINKSATEPEQLSVVQELKNSGVEAVVLLTSPLVFIGLANQAQNQSYQTRWFGPGVTSGLNAVTSFGCPAVATGNFLSPTPGLDVIDGLDPDFFPAYEEYGDGEPADDIGLQLWAINKIVAVMLEATGPELGRAAFMNTLVSTPQFNNQIYTPVTFTPRDHFGGTGAHLLQANCDDKVYVTSQEFLRTD